MGKIITFAGKIFQKMIHIRFVVAWLLKILMWCGIASMVWVVFSCEEFCEQSDRVAIVVAFYNPTTGVLANANVTIKGIGNDSVLYPLGNRQQALLPLNPTADSVSFSIKNGTMNADTIVIRYTRHTGLVSPECGCVTHGEIYEEPKNTGHSISRMVLVNRSATTVSYRQGVINAENIRIYY